MSGFSVDLAPLPSGLSRIRIEAQAQDLGLPPAGWMSPIVAELRVERSGDRISIAGKLEASAWVECVRCLKGYELSLEVPFEVFAERAGTGYRPDEEELERDDYMKFHDGRHLDLRDDAREALLLELPIAPHCREDCRGLCPHCGSDLNEGPCSCVVQKLN